MTNDEARQQVLSASLGSAMNAAITAQAEALVLKHQIAQAARWEEACRAHLPPEQLNRVVAAVQGEMAA